MIKIKSTLFLGMLFLLSIAQVSRAELSFLDNNSVSTSLIFVDNANVGFPLDVKGSICSDINDSVHLFSISLLNQSLNTSIFNVTENTCVPFKVSVVLSNLTEAKIYDITVLALTPVTDRSLSIKVKVDENLMWEVASGINGTLSMNATKNFYGMFTYAVRNNGNAKINLSVSSVGDDFFFFDKGSITLDPQSTLSKPVYFYLPPNVSTKAHSFNITFIDSFNTFKTFKVLINVTDLYAPEFKILEANPNNTEIGQPVLIRAIITDDVNVTKVWTIIDGNEVVFTRNDDIYSTEVKSIVGGAKSYSIVARDAMDNRAIKTVTYNVKQKEVMSLSNNVYFGKMRLERSRTIVFANFNTPTSFTVRLLDFQTSRSIRGGVINITINERDLLNASLQKLDFTDYSGELKITVVENIMAPLPNTSVNLNEYKFGFNGKLRIDTPDSVYNPNGEVFFSGTYDDYDVANPVTLNVSFFTFGEGAQITNMSCNPLDVGVYENSSYNCMMSYPVDIESNNMAVVTTLEAFDAYKTGNDLTINKLSLEKEANARWGLFYFILLFFLVIGLVVKFKVLPNYTKLG